LFCENPEARENLRESPALAPFPTSRSPTPEEILPKVQCRIFVRKNGKAINATKQFQIDLNVDYPEFLDVLYTNIYKKAEAEYDPFDDQSTISIKYAWIPKKRILNGSKQKPIHPTECIDLDDTSDYASLLQDIRVTSDKKKAGETINDMLLYIHASMTIDSTAHRSRNENTDGENDAEEEIRRAVILS
jgi:hypothetical protein